MQSITIQAVMKVFFIFEHLLVKKTQTKQFQYENMYNAMTLPWTLPRKQNNQLINYYQTTELPVFFKRTCLLNVFADVIKL